ncbi:hypothetical protein DIPPA_04673 [Diplonema papillatum]|nr:hypothetical protein DIPPA_04673 [Diplonema papillatum]
MFGTLLAVVAVALPMWAWLFWWLQKHKKTRGPGMSPRNSPVMQPSGNDRSATPPVELFGNDELDRLITTYHWEETEKRRHETNGMLQNRGSTPPVS